MLRTAPGPAASERRLPRRVRAELARRRAALVATLDGRVLDVADVDGGDLDGRPFDAAVCVLGLAASEHPMELLHRVAGLLPPGAPLALLEPSMPTGLRGRTVAAAAPLLAAVTGLRVDRRVPPLVRAAGFIPCSVLRFDMPTAVLPLRPFCEIVARTARS